MQPQPKHTTLTYPHNLAEQALKSAAQLGIIGKFSRSVLRCESFEDILQHATILLNDLQLSGVLLVYHQYAVAKTVFGHGLYRKHVAEIDTVSLSKDRVLVLENTLIFNLKSMNLIVDICTSNESDVSLLQDNLSIWFDTFECVVDSHYQRKELEIEKEELRQVLATNLMNVYSAMHEHSNASQNNANFVFEDCICKINSILPRLGLEYDQEHDITNIIHAMVEVFKNNLDTHIKYNDELEAVVMSIYHELTEAGHLVDELRKEVRVSINGRTDDGMGTSPSELF